MQLTNNGLISLNDFWWAPKPKQKCKNKMRKWLWKENKMVSLIKLWYVFKHWRFQESTTSRRGKIYSFQEKLFKYSRLCRGLWDKKSLFWEIVHLSRRCLVQIICNIKWHGTNKKPKSFIFSTQKPPKWRPIFSVSNYVYSVTNFRVWKSWP